MASPTSSGSEFQIEIRLTKDGELVSRLKGVQTAFTRLGTTSEEVMKKLEDRYNNAAKGSKAYYDAEISHLRTLRDTTATTIKQTREYDARIASLEKRKAKLNQAKRGSINYYKAEIKALREEQRSIAISSKRYKELETQIRKYQGTLDLATKSQGTVVKTNQHMISNAGLAGATLTEFGRTISDANYGIRGMANNLSQLSTLFITLMAKTDGAKNAFKLLLSQLNGPMGFILAFQVAISLLEHFSIAGDKAKESNDALSGSLKEQFYVLDDLIERYEEANRSLEDRNKLLRVIRQVDKDLYEALKNENKSEEEKNKILQRRSELLQAEVAFAKEGDKIRKRQEEVAQKLIDLRIKEEDTYQRLIKTYGDAATEQNKQYARETALRYVLEDRNFLDQEAINLNSQLFELMDGVALAKERYNEAIGKGNQSEEESIKINRELNAQLLQQKLTLENEKEAVDEQSALKKIKTVSDLQLALLEIEEKNAIDKAKQENYTEAQLQAIRSSYALKREILEVQTNSAILSAKRLFESGEIDNLIDYYKTTFEIDEEEAKRRIKLAKWAQGELAKANAGVQEDMMTDLAARGFTGETDKTKKETPEQKARRIERQRKEDLQNIQNSINAVESLFNAQYDAEISREEAKTARINNELKKRLNNEKLSAEQKESINGQIAANEAALQKKRDEIAEKQFKMQKAVNIAQALAETYRTGVLAYGSQLVIGDPTSPIRAQIAQAVAIAAGLANVAMIAKQKFVPSAIDVTGGAGTTGGASSPAVQAPDFNIVGQSQTSQLAELVSGQLDRPVKAYVVSKDISTAQELDRNKIDTAAL